MIEEMEGQLSFADLGLWSGKTSPEPSPQTEEKTSKPCSPKSSKSQSQTRLMCLCLRKINGPTQESSAMIWEDGQLRGDSSTLNFGESPNVGKESLWLLTSHQGGRLKSCLSNVLETNPNPKYNLSPKACQGILNRAQRKGKTLPEQLEKALRIQAEGGAMSFQERAGKPGGGKGILIQDERVGALSTLNNQSVCSFEPGAASRVGGHVYEDDVSGTIRANAGDNQQAIACYGISSYDSNAMKSTLRAQTHGHEPVVCAGFSTEHSAKSRSIGYEEEKSPTLRAGVVPATVFENHSQDTRYNPLGDVCSTVSSTYGMGGNNQPLVVKERQGTTYGRDRSAFNQGQNAKFDFSIDKELIGPQLAKGPGAVAVDCRNGTEDEINGSLQASSYRNNNSNNVCRTSMVRRLTPMECERLQGFPDRWTDIGEWIDSKGKKHKDADSPRYKALGNSIALPFWFWLLRRISSTYTRRATLGSLFDGIGGFPLCWEMCNGKGTARWASEIEEFPIAVTKARFPENPDRGGSAMTQ